MTQVALGLFRYRNSLVEKVQRQETSLDKDATSCGSRCPAGVDLGADTRAPGSAEESAKAGMIQDAIISSVVADHGWFTASSPINVSLNGDLVRQARLLPAIPEARWRVSYEIPSGRDGRGVGQRCCGELGHRCGERLQWQTQHESDVLMNTSWRSSSGSRCGTAKLTSEWRCTDIGGRTMIAIRLDKGGNEWITLCFRRAGFEEDDFRGYFWDVMDVELVHARIRAGSEALDHSIAISPQDVVCHRQLMQ